MKFQTGFDMVYIERTVYTVLDMFSDIGGLVGFLMGVIAFMLSVWNKDMLNERTARKLYKVAPIDEKDYRMPATCGGKCKVYCRHKCQSIVPSACHCSRCCKQDKWQLAMQKAKEELVIETSLLTIVRQIRYLKSVVRLQNDQSVRKKLKKDSLFGILAEELNA